MEGRERQDAAGGIAEARERAPCRLSFLQSIGRRSADTATTGLWRAHGTAQCAAHRNLLNARAHTHTCPPARPPTRVYASCGRIMAQHGARSSSLAGLTCA